jgi:hypothetical protein
MGQVARNATMEDRSPYVNACAECCVRSVKEEALSRFMLFGERSLHHVLTEYVAHYHEERLHQGKGNAILLPSAHTDLCATHSRFATRSL